jgi:hypothetical protein
MAISVRSVLVGFASLVVYYGFYYVLSPFIQTFSSSHSNSFNVFVVVLIPIIIFISIIAGIFTNPTQGGYRG